MMSGALVGVKDGGCTGTHVHTRLLPQATRFWRHIGLAEMCNADGCEWFANVVDAAALGQRFNRQLASDSFVGTDVDEFDAVDQPAV